ncbi:hypothetical protein M5689_016200 [Euphorbia peplus]|nr:hypothetical protein M5689_016200 [Euphorbia peplus]
MEDYRRRLVWLCVGVFLFILSAAEAKKDGGPLTRVNLSPVRQWRSAWECLQNKTNECSATNTIISMSGVLIINGTELTDFCQNGCLNHTKTVLKCVHWVKRDFWFANGATVPNISATIDHACSSNSSLDTNFKSSAIRAYQHLLVPLIAVGTVLMVILSI